MTIKLSKTLSLPVEISGRRTAVFGISGSGKSNTATVIIEGLLHAGEQVVLIDPKGEAWGLLSMASGKPSNLPLVIFGEPNGHISELSETHGPKLADFVFESGQSVALSLVGFESDQSERRFVATFMRQLYRRKSKAAKKTRTLVVLDEAHLFIPETTGQGMKGDKAELSGAVQRIARQGRTFGLGTLVIDQRPQDVSKRVVTQVDTIICHQMTHKLDRDALSDWVRGHDVENRGKTFLDSLASLEPGEAWIWSPSWLKIFQRVQADRRKTFDSGAAPDETDGVTQVKRAEIDLDKLRGQLTEIVEKAKADDPKELRKQLAEQRQQHEKAARSFLCEILDLKLLLDTRPAVAPERVEVPVIGAPEMAKLDEVYQGASKALENMSAVLVQFRDTISRSAPGNNPAHNLRNNSHQNRQSARNSLAAPGNGRHSGIIPDSRTIPRTKLPETSVSSKPHRDASNPSNRAAASSNGDLGKAERAILSAFYWLKDEDATPAKVSFFSGYSSGSSTWNNALGRLRHSHLSGWRITLAGIETVEGWGGEPKPTGSKLRDDLRRRLGKAENALLDALVAAYPSRLSAAELSEASGYSLGSSTWNNAIGRLRTLEAAEGYERDGGTKAADVFFEGK